jgi:hypothetical protein
VFVIPPPTVAEAVANDHASWLATPGQQGQAHKPTKMRRLRPKMSGMPAGWMDEHLEAWYRVTG